MTPMTTVARQPRIQTPSPTGASAGDVAPAVGSESARQQGGAGDLHAGSSVGEAHAGGPNLKRFQTGNARTALEPGQSGSGEALAQTRATRDLGVGSERSQFTKQAELYSGVLSAEMVTQRGPMRGSHTASRETAVASLGFVDTRGFFGDAAAVEVELVPRHTLVDRSVLGGQMVEQQNPGVLGEAVRVRLERDDNGVYRAQAPANHAFFVTDSESGYARRILEDVLVSVHGRDGVEDTAYGARYALLGS